MSDEKWAVVAVAMRRVSIALFLGGLLATAVDAVLFFWLDDRISGDLTEAFLGIGLIGLATGGFGMVAAHVIARNVWCRLMLMCVIGLTISMGGWILVAASSYTRWGFQSGGFIALLVAISLPSGSVILAGVAMSVETESNVLGTISRLVARSLVYFSVAVVAVVVMTMAGLESDWIYLGMIVWGGLSLVAVGVLPAAARWADRPRGQLIRTLPKRIKLLHTCPGCQEWIESPAGPVRCDWCGLRMLVDVVEPRCACGYLLYELQGTACPECGRSIDVPSDPGVSMHKDSSVAAIATATEPPTAR